MKRNEAFPTGFFKAADFENGNLTLTIKSIAMKSIGQGDDATDKPHLSFNEDHRELALNLTNWNFIADVYGDESDEWIGKQITLYKARVPFGGKIVDAIRVEVPNPIATQNTAPASTRAPQAAPSQNNALDAPMTKETRAAIIDEAVALYGEADAPAKLREYLAPATLSGLSESAARSVLDALQKTPQPVAAAADDFDDTDPFGDI